MSDTPTAGLPSPMTVDRKAIIAANPRIKSAARWFWWIAGLSAINSIFTATGSRTTFLVGLGITQLADGFFRAFKPAAYVIDLAGIGFFFAIGLIARRGYRWAFVVGGIAYALDALIYLYFNAYMPLAFHAWALFFIATGGIALNRIINDRELAANVPRQ